MKKEKDIFMSLDLREMNDLLYLLTYSHSNEKKHWEEEGKPKNHVYHSIKRLYKLFPMYKEIPILVPIKEGGK